MSLNKVTLMGRLTRDPEVRYTQGAEPMAIARYALAVNRRYKREGDPDADFINIVAFGRNGEFAEKYFNKGMQVVVVGRIQTGSYEKDGVRRYTTDIVAEEQHFAESKREQQAQAQPTQSKPTDTGFVQVEDMDEDDIPF